MTGYIYGSPEVFALEREKIFLKDWLCVARVEELEKPGDYLTLHIAREPMVVTRNREGELRAFSNMCAHRGAQIAFDRGNVMRFSCPYHGWSYDLDGRLTGAAYMTEAREFSKEQVRLPPVRLAVWQDWIFVNFDEAAPPLEEALCDLDREYGFLRQQDLRLGARFDLELDGNWKLVVEKLIASSLGRRARGANPLPRGGISAVHASGSLSPDGRPLFRKMDVLAGKPDNFAALAHLAPNACMVVRSDHVQQLVSWPVAPGKTRLAAYMLFPAGLQADAAFPDNAQTYAEALRRNLLQEDARQEAYATLDKALGNSFQHYLGRVFA